ncbi:hypothetical protein AB0958_34480 [Streptomyces sp. NPDC006655]|uniref:hypothetical protein n=1 Tax=Streptomyces sp. NPDC006655 TaxID=3156898 RepID=UPI003454CE7F
MLSTPNADQAWKGMTRSFPSQGATGRHRSAAGTAAYSTLLRDPQDSGEPSPRAEQWLLLRDRTATRLTT